MALTKITGKDFKEAVDWLLKEKQGCVHQVLGRTDEGTELCLVIGWADIGYDLEEVKKNGYEDEGYYICSKIGYQHRNNGMQSDFEWDFPMPYNPETGDVWDTDTYVAKGDEQSWQTDADMYNKEAEKIWATWGVPNEDGQTTLDIMESKKKEAKKNEKQVSAATFGKDWVGADVYADSDARIQVDLPDNLFNDLAATGEVDQEDYAYAVDRFLDSCYNSKAYVSVGGNSYPLGVCRDPKLLIVQDNGYQFKGSDQAVELVKKLANGELTGHASSEYPKDDTFVAIKEKVGGREHYILYYADEGKSEAKKHISSMQKKKESLAKKVESALDIIRVSDEDVVLVPEQVIVEHTGGRSFSVEIPTKDNRYYLSEMKEILKGMCEDSSGYLTAYQDGSVIVIIVNVPAEDENGEWNGEYNEDYFARCRVELVGSSCDSIADYLREE